MFRTPTTGRRLGRLIGAAVIGTGLVISGAGVASANAAVPAPPRPPCLEHIRDAEKLTKCWHDFGAHDEWCDNFEDGFSLQQCLMARFNVGFDLLPGSPENPGTPRAGATPKPAPKVAPKAPTKQKASKAPTKKKPAAKKPTRKATRR